MDIATLIGLVLTFVLIVGSILLGGSIMAFVDVPSLLIVVGGVITTTLIMQKLPVVLATMRVVVQSFFDHGTPEAVLVEKIVELADKARREGLLALESIEIPDAFLNKAIKLAVDGTELDEINQVLTAEVNSLKTRHGQGQEVLEFMKGNAPALGMIGTLIGLVNMLQHLSDPTTLGPSMAVALITTFYGAILSFIIFGPIHDKLKSRTAAEVNRMEMCILGVNCLNKGEHPRLVKEKLLAFLPPLQRAALTEAK
ncbi:MAG: motility protein A [Nitrospirae bacterium CG_4_8_14_3_um_filter_70_85]|nr:MAG: motility protein A [Nitrospirae bacterium CG_4_8_14_3_um_filter_70_85]